MPAAVKGTAHIFGTGGPNGNGFTITNATVADVSITPAFERNDETSNEAGVIIETRRDSRSFKGTIDLFIRSGYTIPQIGSVIAVSGLTDSQLNRNYEIVSTPQQYAAGEKVRLQLTVESHEGITINV